MNRRLMKAGEKNYLKESRPTVTQMSRKFWKSRIYMAPLKHQRVSLKIG